MLKEFSEQVRSDERQGYTGSILVTFLGAKRPGGGKWATSGIPDASQSGGNSSYARSLSKKPVELSFVHLKLSKNIQSRFLFAKNLAYGLNATSVPVADAKATKTPNCEETAIAPPKVGSFFDNYLYKASGRGKITTSDKHPPMPKFGQGDARLIEGEISPTTV
ncbi:hypothetical protein RUND412_002939 [Rhizina undulata]